LEGGRLLWEGTLAAKGDGGEWAKNHQGRGGEVWLGRGAWV